MRGVKYGVQTVRKVQGIFELKTSMMRGFLYGVQTVRRVQCIFKIQKRIGRLPVQNVILWIPCAMPTVRVASRV